MIWKTLSPLLVLSLVLSSGCVGKGGISGDQAFQELEVVTSLDQVLSEVKNTPTRFSLGIPDSTYGWERAQLFFKEHTSRSNFSAGKDNLIILTNPKDKDPISYRVEKRDIKHGIEFFVSCKSGSHSLPPEKISLACRNLARFIREGRLEESLIPTSNKND